MTIAICTFTAYRHDVCSPIPMVQHGTRWTRHESVGLMPSSRITSQSRGCGFNSRLWPFHFHLTTLGILHRHVPPSLVVPPRDCKLESDFRLTTEFVLLLFSTFDISCGCAYINRLFTFFLSSLLTYLLTVLWYARVSWDELCGSGRRWLFLTFKHNDYLGLGIIRRISA